MCLGSIVICQLVGQLLVLVTVHLGPAPLYVCGVGWPPSHAGSPSPIMPNLNILLEYFSLFQLYGNPGTLN